MKLYPYQQNDILKIIDLFKKTNHVSLIYATGAGKTVIARTVATLLNLPFIITAPTNTIKSSFTSSLSVNINNIDLKLLDIIQFKDNQQINTNRYLSNEVADYGIVISYSLLSKKFINFLPKNKLLIVDESHHAGKVQKLYQFAKYWKDNGGLILSLSATPVRSNEECSLASEAEFKVIRSISAQMRSGFAPKEIDFDLIRVNSMVGKDSDSIFGAPINIDILTEEIVHQLILNGSPKTIIRCQNTGDTNKNNEIINSIATALEDQNFRVLKATTDTNLTDLESFLSIERTIKSFSDSKIDVIVGINAVCEGLDWPIASHFCFIGIPTSVLLTSQGLGRTTRKKTFEDRLHDYPIMWKETSKVLMFTGNVKNIKTKHGSAVLKVISYMGAMKQLSILHKLTEVFNNKFSKNETEEFFNNDIKQIIPNETATTAAKQAILYIQSEFSELVQICQPLLPKDLVELFKFYQSEYKMFPDCTERDLKFAISFGNKQNQDEIISELTEKLEKVKNISEVNDILNNIVNDFIETTTNNNMITYDEQALIQSLKVTSDTIDSFAKQVDEVQTISFAEAIK